MQIPAFVKSEQIMSMLIGIIVVILNRVLHLGLTNSDLIIIGGIIGSVVLGESHKDAMAPMIGQAINIAEKVEERKDPVAPPPVPKN